MLKTFEINIRDPFVLPYEGKYYLTGTRGPTCWGPADGFDCYISEDLENWEGPIEIFHRPDGFWADRNFWAPEIHPYRGAFYLFASFKAEGKDRGTQILKAKRPDGPYELYSNGPVTPKGWECLDGTLYLAPDHTPYLVFCHEWTQVGDGQICAVQLSADLKQAIGMPQILFSASSFPQAGAIGEDQNFVTDGPFLWQTRDGSLLMLWSTCAGSNTDQSYIQAVARSASGRITGPWQQEPQLLFEQNGGHGMLFQTFEGRLLLTLHSPNESLLERPVFMEILDSGTSLQVKN